MRCIDCGASASHWLCQGCVELRVTPAFTTPQGGRGLSPYFRSRQERDREARRLGDALETTELLEQGVEAE